MEKDDRHRRDPRTVTVSAPFPSPPECRDALDRIAASEQFAAAPRLTAFLRFVVEAAISGQSKSIKAYTVAVGALGRPADFDPTADSIVRVEAGRLRDALGSYYSGRGTNDPVTIRLPRGSYVPVFSRKGHTRGLEVLDTFAVFSTLTAARRRHAALFTEHREQRQIFARNLEIFKINMRALKKSLEQAVGRGGAARGRLGAKTRL